ncbi:hypothetical protein P691DRAFT_777515 [Macrolepiota fuliginosa MF-IS2]|uniref:F-box domain-containing protein n=1 Tax=Macrolepiota fuliginosa MF-IS2 TaxID=1400762 RepID=A0A9P5X8Y9_9AGAR|nr:hypothetical protein P691DRAFT_777515 [Macrolepiota fuliginosa MF-IS2]
MTTNQSQDLGAMPQCLAIPEIFDLICRQVRLKGQENTAILAALARTCRAWSDIALDNLWHTIFGISSLVRCMPQDLWCLEKGVLTLRRPLRISDIHVLRKYALRVRVLDHEEFLGSFVRVHRSIYRALLLSSNDCLLPRLEKLRWASKSGTNTFHFIRLFLSPGLKVLDLIFDPDHTEHPGFYTLPAVFCPHTIPTIFCPHIIPTIFCPHISELSIYNFPLVLAEPVPSVPPAWSPLVSLRMGDVTLKDLVYIARLPALEHLTFDKLSSLWNLQTSKAAMETQLLESLHAMEQPFSTLKVLTMIVYMPIKGVTKLFKFFRDVKFTQLNIRLRYIINTVDDLRELIETVARNCHVNSLKNFNLLYPTSNDVAFLTVLRPLLKFQALERVDLEGFFAMELTNEDVVEIASSLPSIRSLSLPFRYPFICPLFRDSDHPLPTLSVLLAFAKCTELRYLSLEIDASDEVARHILWMKPEGERIRNYSLRTLSVGWSPISHKEFVASFLSEVFPNLGDVDSSPAMGKDDEPRYHQWQYVSQTLSPTFSWVRRGEYGGGASCEALALERPSRVAVEDEDGDWLGGGELNRLYLNSGGG